MTDLPPAPVPSTVESRILTVRDRRVLLDSDLAQLYGVSTGRLNEQVRRNRERFPADFLIELSWDEFDSLRSQSAILETGRSGRGRHRKHPPLAFTEQGISMLSSVLRSPRAIQVNILIMRAFVRLRELTSTHIGLSRKLDELERRYDARFRSVFEAIRALIREKENGTR